MDVAAPAATERSRLHRAMDLIAEEVAEIFRQDAGRFEPRMFKRVNQLMKICRALRTEADTVTNRLSPEEREAALGRPQRFGLNPHPLDDAEDPDDYRDPMDDGHRPMGVFPAQRADGNFNTEMMLAATELMGMLGRKNDTDIRTARADEALQISKLLEAKFVSDERKQALQHRLDELLSTVANPEATHEQPALPAANPNLVSADDVR